MKSTNAAALPNALELYMANSAFAFGRIEFVAERVMHSPASKLRSSFPLKILAPAIPEYAGRLHTHQFEISTFPVDTLHKV